MKLPIRPMSWFPRNVGSWYTFESASVYQSSPSKNVRSASVGAESAAKPLAAAWNGKSSTAWIRSRVVKCDVNAFVVSKTSPNMKNSRLPRARA